MKTVQSTPNNFDDALLSLVGVLEFCGSVVYSRKHNPVYDNKFRAIRRSSGVRGWQKRLCGAHPNLLLLRLFGCALALEHMVLLLELLQQLQLLTIPDDNNIVILALRIDKTSQLPCVVPSFRKAQELQSSKRLDLGFESCELWRGSDSDIRLLIENVRNTT